MEILKKQLKDIEDELQHLRTKKIQLITEKQQKAKQQPFYIRWLQSKLTHDCLELEKINTEIELLKADEKKFLESLEAGTKAAAVSQLRLQQSPPELDENRNKSPFYSHTLESWNIVSPMEQLGFYVLCFFSIRQVTKVAWKSWNIRKAAEALQNGPDNQSLFYHRYWSGLTDIQLKDAISLKWYRFAPLGAVAFAGLTIGAYSYIIQSKNRFHFNK